MPRPGIASVLIGLATLRANPLRTALSTLGIIVGAASLVAVLALGDGLERYSREQIQRTTDVQSVVIQPVTGVYVDGQTYPVEGYPVFTRLEADSLLAAIPQARGASITLAGRSPIQGESGAEPRVRVTATLPSAAELLGFHFAAGRYFTREEARENRPVVVLTHGLAERLTGRSGAEAIGRQVTLRDRSREVIGVLAKAAGEAEGAVFVPLEAQRDALAPTPQPRAPDLVLQAASVEAVPAVQAAAERWLAAHYADSKRIVRVRTNRVRLRQLNQGMRVFKLALGAITGISLLVGGIGIMNVLLAAVSERTREIGVRRAIGARARDLLAQFLAESVAIAGAGSVIGAGVGLAGAFGITAMIRHNTAARVYAAFSWETLVVAAAAALLVGLIFGMYPALRAARLSPIDAIRHE